MMSKINTIPDEHERLATLSYWLRCYPFMASNPAWLRGLPISDRCKAMYPEIVASLQAESRPRIIEIVPKSAKVRVAA